MCLLRSCAAIVLDAARELRRHTEGGLSENCDCSGGDGRGVVDGRVRLERISRSSFHEHKSVERGAGISLGAGDTTIHLPASVGISASTSGLVGDTNVSGLEKRDGRWINPRANGSPVTIDLDVKHAIGDLRLVAE